MKRVSSVQLAAVLAAAGALWAWVHPARAQPSADVAGGNVAGSVTGFSLPYKQGGVLKARFTGASSISQSATLHLVRQFRVETYRDDGTPELVGEAPECLLNLSTKDISSAGPLAVRQADGQFTVRGEGFVWHHESGRLVLSNKVHTTFRLNL